MMDKFKASLMNKYQINYKKVKHGDEIKEKL